MDAAPNPLHADLLEDGRVLRLRLDRPKGNVLTMAVMVELGAALAAHARDPHLRLVLITAAGPHFSFGASVEEHRPAQAPAMLAAFHALIRQVASYPVPLAAAVQGRCLGGAFELALACHFVLAAPDAVFGCPEIKLGVFPPVLAVLGPLRLGGARAEHLLLTGADLDARAAREAGLVAALLPEGAEPEAAALDWYRRTLAPLSACALREAAAVARLGSGLWAALDAALAQIERRYVERLLPSHDGTEGIEAFLARRAPAWEDR